MPNIKIKRWSAGYDWDTTVENFGEYRFDKKEMGRLLSVLVCRGVLGEGDLSYIFDKEIEIEILAPEGCLKIWEIR
jgi:hypothetical protein